MHSSWSPAVWREESGELARPSSVPVSSRCSPTDARMRRGSWSVPAGRRPFGQENCDPPGPSLSRPGVGRRCPDLRTALWGLIPHPLCNLGQAFLLEGVYPDTPIGRCRPVRGGLAGRTRPHRHPASHGCLEESRRRASAGRLQCCGYAFRTSQCFQDALQRLPVARRHLQG